MPDYRTPDGRVPVLVSADAAELLTLEAQGINIAEIARRISRKPNSVKGRLMTLARRDARAELREAA